VPHLLRHGISVFKVISERPVILTSECRALGQGAITTYFKRLRFDTAGPSRARTHDLPFATAITLMSQGFLQSRLQTSFRKFYDRSLCYNDLVCHCNLPLGQMLSDVFHTICWAILDSRHIDLYHGSFRSSDLEIVLTVGMTY
jgi:hypothetical protein